jgi:hypothetical protein
VVCLGFREAALLGSGGRGVKEFVLTNTLTVGYGDRIADYVNQ